MTSDREALLNENQRLRKVNRRWRFVAFVAIACAFLVMVPFTIAINRGVLFFLKRDLDAMMRQSDEDEKEMQPIIDRLEKEFRELERTKKEYESRNK